MRSDFSLNILYPKNSTIIAGSPAEKATLINFRVHYNAIFVKALLLV